MRKTFVRFFTVADFEEEEQWLRKQSKQGWKLVKMIPPCFFVFEECKPQDVIYRLDYKNNTQTENYMQMLSDFSWEYCGKCLGWLYFRKPSAKAKTAADAELFSDDASRADRVTQIVRTRLFPLTIIFLCCVLPNLTRAIGGEYVGSFGTVLACVSGVLFVLYMFLIVYCGVKLKRLKDRYTDRK